MAGFFDGFALEQIEVPAGRVRLRHGGSGPPLLLVHGNRNRTSCGMRSPPRWPSGTP